MPDGLCLNPLSVSTVDPEMEPRQFVSAIENERARVARELHDDIAQRLAVNAIELRLLHDHIPTSQPDLRERVLMVYRQLAQVANDVGSLSRRLHPSIVSHLGVVAAIRSECDNSARLTGSPVQFECHCHPANLPETTALALFRIAQEALRNVAKHAPKATVQVSLERIERKLRLRVQDDGDGFDPELCNRGLGLLSMRERANVCGGTLTVHSRPGTGTRVEAFIPLAAGSD